MIKEFVKSLEELLLVVSTKFSKERGVVGLLFLFNHRFYFGGCKQACFLAFGASYEVLLLFCTPGPTMEG